MKLAFVIHRYGDDLVGGSEAHCRAIAERLSTRHEVTVLTSCARDYVTWKNTYPPGPTTVGPVQVRRFPVERPRRMGRFNALSEIVYAGRASDAEERAWFEENGPRVPALIEHLATHGADHDLVLFWSYRYYQSYFGVPVVRDRAVLVPTAEADRLIGARTLGRFFQLPRAYVFLTPEEQELVAALSEGPLPRSVTIGTGIEPASATPTDGPEAARARGLEGLDLPDPFVLYLGRVERNKGCDVLLDYFTRYVEDSYPDTTLVLAGPLFMPVPEHPRIRPLGFVADEVRESLLGQAAVMVVPSPYESLNIALLEGWNHACPALVNGRCQVLRGQVLRAHGGLPYERYEDFAESLAWLLTERSRAGQLGRQGLAYVDRHYRWPVVLGQLEAFLRSL